jgi:multidrug efflux pump subunit AcrA (membrane-fusion protein)
MMSSLPMQDPLFDDARREIRGLIQEIAQLCQSDLPPADFHREFLARVVRALAAAGGVTWFPGEEGPRAECVIGLTENDLGADAERRTQHARLLQKALTDGEPRLMPPLSAVSAEEAWGNPTEFLLLVAPLKTGSKIHAVIEVFQRPGKGPVTQRGFLRFLVDMCEQAGQYLQTHQLRQFTDRQMLWTQWDAFARAAHANLDPKETAYTIANEARKLLGCDRVTIALRKGKTYRVEAVSGQDIFDARATTITLLEKLATAVGHTGEPLCYIGDLTDLAPQVEAALEAYVDSSHAKTVAVYPLIKPRPEDPRGDVERGHVEPLGALIVEQLGEGLARDVLTDRVAVVRDHSVAALSNALEHQGLFLMPLWRALGRGRWLVQGKTLPKTIAVTIAVLLAGIALVAIPADFELEGRGTLQPVTRREVFAGIDGVVQVVHARHGDVVRQGDLLAELRNVDLDVQITDLKGQRATTLEKKNAIDRAMLGESRLTPVERTRLKGEGLEARQALDSIDIQLELLARKRKQLEVRSPIDGEVVTWNVVDLLERRPVHRGDALITVADPSGDWELEVRMPEDRMGHIVRAQQANDGSLDVEYILATDPGTSLAGRVKEVHRSAEVRGEEGNTVLIKVSIDPGELSHPRPGAEVTARVHCGRRPLGYVWFHDLVAFVQSRILFRI